MRCNTTRQHFTSSKEMLNKNGVVPLSTMGLEHSNSRQETHKQLKHMRLRFVTGRNVPSHTEFINTWPNRLASSSCNRNHGTVCAGKTNLTADPSSSFLLLLHPHPCGFHVCNLTQAQVLANLKTCFGDIFCIQAFLECLQSARFALPSRLHADAVFTRLRSEGCARARVQD